MNQLKSINPYTLSEISSVNELTKKEIGEILGRSEGTFSEYKLTSFEYRKERMEALAKLLETGAGIYGPLITSEMGKPLREAEAEVKKCAWVCNYYAENAAQFLEERFSTTEASVSKVIYQALGPVLAVMPWNFPFWQVFRYAAPTVMAGNTALLKHASNVQACANAIEELFRKAGFPHGVFQNLAISATKVADVIASPEVKAVTLTGSEPAGASVASIAGQHLKKCVLELGGNNAFVVLNDADIDHAVEVALKARLQNGGQSCIAAKRFIIEEDVIGEFLVKLLLKLEQLEMGDPMDKSTDMGPLFSVIQAEEVDDQVKRSVSKGAKLIFGGKREHAFYEASVLTEVVPGMPVFEEETFGPQHALDLSNQSDFGLGMQVFTSSEESVNLFINGAEEGAVFVNEMVKSDPRLPFGGIKRSGYGRELAREGILEFMNAKTIYLK
ncbi:NAD-dependent succinate-semialdehyde dehydrogenase [Bacteroidota bacterium]